ncbi:MAG: ATP-binding protein [Herpetosiphonaceae bacterium]|nr:ATP-binding protein [Herpetosiphonaceae bacterium]
MDSPTLLDTYLKQLCLPTFSQQYRRLAADATRTQASYEQFLLTLVEQEILTREQHRLQRLMRAARFPVVRDLADFDFAAIPSVNQQQIHTLSQGHYIPAAESVLLIGNPGLGKTHIASGLALAACKQGYRVRFYTAAALVNDLLQAQAEHRINRFMTQALKYQLIVLDELGFIPLSTVGAQLLFQFCSGLYERVAVMVTSNLRFADWTQVFGDERLTAALLDRLTHKAHILEFIGDSHRIRQRMQQERRGLVPDVAGDA